MKMFRQGLLATFAGGTLFALTFGFAGPANAVSLGGNFDVDQSCGVPGAASPCSETKGTISNVDHINFNYSARVDQRQVGAGFLDIGDDPFDEVGFMNWSSFIDDGGNALDVAGPDYKVYGLFSASGFARGGPGGSILVDFTSFTIDLYMDDARDTTLTLPAAASPLGAVTVTDVSGDDALLGTATLLGADQARIFSGLANGDFEVILTDLGLSVLGTSFFSSPVPFYNIMDLTGVTTNVSGASGVSPFIATLDGSGDLFFPVPEPGSLSLLGLALMGMGFISRRRRNKISA